MNRRRTLVIAGIALLMVLILALFAATLPPRTVLTGPDLTNTVSVGLTLSMSVDLMTATERSRLLTEAAPTLTPPPE